MKPTCNISAMSLLLLLLLHTIDCIDLSARGTPFSSLRGGNRGDKPKIYIGVVFHNDIKLRKRSGAVHEVLSHSIASNTRKYSIVSAYDISLRVVAVPAVTYPLETVRVICNNMTKEGEQVSALLYATAHERYGKSTASEQYFMHMNSFTGIPLVGWNADNSGILSDTSLQAHRVIQMAPSIEEQVNAMTALLQRYGWSKICVVTTGVNGWKHFHALWREKENEGEGEEKFRVEVMHALHLNLDDESGNITEAAEELNRLTTSEVRIFVVYATKTHARSLFPLADSAGLTGRGYLWIGTQSIVSNEDYKQYGHNRAPEEYQMGMLAVHFDTDMEDSPGIKEGIQIIARALSIVYDADKSFNFRPNISCQSEEHYKWEEGGGVLYDALLATRLRIRTSQRTLRRLTFDDGGRLMNNRLTIYNLGREGRKKGWKDVRDGCKSGKVWYLQIATLEEPPFVVVTDVDPQSGECPSGQSRCNWGITHTGNAPMDNTTTIKWKCCTGYSVDLLQKLATDVGFTFDMYRVADGMWGMKNTSTGRWSGLIRELVDLEADMVVTSLKINSYRAEDIDFSVPFLKTGIAILVKIRKGALSPTAFLEPFEYNTWVLILIVSIQAAGIAILFFEWVSPDSFDMTTRPAPGHKFSLCRALWLVWATLFSASVNTDVPRSYTARFMALVWAAFCLTFLAVYTANLAAFMITRTEFYDLAGVDDPLLTRPTDVRPPFMYGTVRSGNTDDTLRNNYPKIHRQLMAFIYDAVVLDYLAGKDGDCQLLTVGTWFSKTGYGFGFQKNSKHAPVINKWMLRYQEKGDLERLQNFWLTGACQDQGSSRKTRSVPLGIENFMSAFVLLGAGIVVGIAILCMEHVYVNHLGHRLRRWDRRGWLGLISMTMGQSPSSTMCDIALRVADENNEMNRIDAAREREEELLAQMSLKHKEMPPRKCPTFSEVQTRASALQPKHRRQMTESAI